MADRMGLTLRPYQELEFGDRDLKSRHVRLAEAVALDVAIERKEWELAPLNVRHKVIKFARIMLLEKFREKTGKLVDAILNED